MDSWRHLLLALDQMQQSRPLDREQVLRGQFAIQPKSPGIRPEVQLRIADSARTQMGLWRC